MPYQITTAIKKIHQAKKRIRVIQGGTAAGKTIGILAILIDRCQRDKKPTITSVVSESFPHLKRGAMRDFLSMMEEQGYFDPKRWNKTDSTYTFETGSKLEFFSADQPDKVRGPRRDRLFLNEANNIPFDTFEQLEVRTREFIVIDYNPVAEFWYHEHIAKREDIDFLVLTYKDNEALEKSIVESIEMRKDRKNWWLIYGMGQLGILEGIIYSNWRIIDEIPHEARLMRTGLDFGYTNDESAIVDIYYYDQGYILDEILYRKGMSNKQLADTLNAKERQALVIADSAEPKSIDELKAYGINILPSMKGPGSVNRGIDFVQSQAISVTKRSVNLIKEYRNYLWLVDKDGKITNEEDPACKNHCMAAIRYGLGSLRPNEEHLLTKLEDRFIINEARLSRESTR